MSSERLKITIWRTSFDLFGLFSREATLLSILWPTRAPKVHTSQFKRGCCSNFTLRGNFSKRINFSLLKRTKNLSKSSSNVNKPIKKKLEIDQIPQKVTS